MIKQARNSQCHCGSGKKAKKCCLLDMRKFHQHLVNRFHSDLAHDEARMIAGIGGLPKYTTPEEPEISPSNWMCWLLLIFITLTFLGFVSVFIARF